MRVIGYRKTQAPAWANRLENAPDESIFATDDWRGTCLKQEVALALVSPRPCVVTAGEVSREDDLGPACVVRNHAGKGQTFLLGFCVQDTYFKTWEDESESARCGLSGVFHALTRKASVQPHVRSSNPDIEASLRANDREAFLFVINHESDTPDTTVELRDLGFPIGRIIDLKNDQEVTRVRGPDGAVELKLSVNLGQVLLLNVLPGEGDHAVNQCVVQLKNSGWA